MLLDGAGEVVAVIDIEAIGSGTRVFDYATLLDHADTEAEAVELLVDAGRDVAGPAALLTCFVHEAVDLIGFMTTRSTEDDLQLRIRQLTERLDVVARQ